MGLYQRKKVHVMQFVPTYIEALLSHLEATNQPYTLTEVKFLILSGEEVTPKIINTWFKWYPHIPILNAYGPSEASDIVSQELFLHVVNPSQNHISIGTPLPNVQLFILDKNRKNMPFFASGEIYIAGIAVGKGYWRDGDKTKVAFIEHPFNLSSGRKWYRTGDYGRLWPSGKVEYLGRVDSQIKIRGFRVELGEIEKVFLEDARVKQCKVQRRLLNEQDALCAYIVLHDFKNVEGQWTTIEEALRVNVCAVLPDYMVPQYIQLIEMLPTLPGGKIDVNNLPEPRRHEKKNTLPSDEWEFKMRDIVASTVGVPVESIGMQSNFFDIGGTSIHLMAMKFQIKEQFGMEIPIDSLFRLDTIQELVASVKSSPTSDHLKQSL